MVGILLIFIFNKEKWKFNLKRNKLKLYQRMKVMGEGYPEKKNPFVGFIKLAFSDSQ